MTSEALRHAERTSLRRERALSPRRASSTKKQDQSDSISPLLACSSAQDILLGNIGKDTLYGGSNGDTLYGGGGSDLIYGEGGSDTLYGCTGDVDDSAANDKLFFC